MTPHIPRELRARLPTGRASRALDQQVRDYWGQQAWVCQLCGGSIDQAAPPGSPWSWSKDHILPRALGGGNDLANLQPAHLLHNKQKGASIRRMNSRRNGVNNSREW